MYEDDHESDDEAPLLSSINKRINIRDSGSFIPDDAEEKVHHVANQRSNKANPSNTSHISQFTVGQHAAMASYWFGWSFLWLPLLIVLIPFQVAHIAGPGGKGMALGMTLLSGSGLSLIFAPLFGTFSDTCTHPMGRRRPYMILGGVISTIALFFMSISPDLSWFSFSFLLLSLANNMIVSPYSALVPDCVPPAQRGVSCGWLGWMSILGYLGGGCVSYHLSSIGLFGVYFILIIVHIVSLIITVYYTDEIPLSVLRRGSTNSSSTGLGSGNIPSTRRVRDMSDRSGSSGSGSYRHRDGDAKDVGDADTVTKANATLFDSRAAHKDNTYINDHDDDGNDDNNEEEDVMAATHRFLSPKDEDELFLSNDSGPATGGSSADSMTQAFRDFCVLTFHTMVVSAFVELKTKQEQRDRRLPHSSSPPSSGPETCMGTLRSARDSFCLLVCSFYEPLLCRDFRIVFMTRFIIQLGVLTVQEYLQYYLEDAIGPVYMLSGVVVATNAQEAVTILFMPVLLGALISSIGAGYISDRFGGRRKLIVYWSGALMGAACLMFSITRNYSLDMFLGLVFGIGFGAFSVMDWALITDVLSNEGEYAKDMGILSLALVLPQVIATPIAGLVLDYFQNVLPGWNLGYTMVFLLACGYYVLGTYFVKFIENIK